MEFIIVAPTQAIDTINISLSKNILSLLSTDPTSVYLRAKDLAIIWFYGILEKYFYWVNAFPIFLLLYLNEEA